MQTRPWAARRPSGTVAIAAGAATLGLLGVLAALRAGESRLRDWGATSEEAVRRLPGDEQLEVPDLVTTRAISIAAPASAVWPWLVQMGPGRAGAYTYDWIENLWGLDMHSADRIVEELQHVELGDAWTLGAKGPTLRLVVLDPGHAMVLASDDGHWVWAFVLVEDATGTRLLSRNRIVSPSPSRLARAAYAGVMVPASLVMERKMLLGIQQRAEGLARDHDEAPQGAGHGAGGARAAAGGAASSPR